MDFDEDDWRRTHSHTQSLQRIKTSCLPSTSWFVKVPHNQLAHHIITFFYAWIRRYNSNWWIFRWKWHENTLCVYWETKLTLLCETLCFIHQCLSGNYLACFTSFFPEILHCNFKILSTRTLYFHKQFCKVRTSTHAASARNETKRSISQAKTDKLAMW